MSPQAKAMKLLFRMGRVKKPALEKALADGVLTQEEYGEILGGEQ